MEFGLCFGEVEDGSYWATKKEIEEEDLKNKLERSNLKYQNYYDRYHV
jgi:hypothetical protein